MICNSLILNFHSNKKKIKKIKQISSMLITNLNDSFLKIRLLHYIGKALLMPTQFISSRCDV